MDSLPGGVMALAPMSDLLQLPQSERLALAIALGDSPDDHALGNQDGGNAWPDARMNVASMS